jgi:hypothetical protein
MNEDSHRRDPLAKDRAVQRHRGRAAGNCELPSTETLHYLLRKPRCPEMPRSIEPHNFTAIMSQDDHDVGSRKEADTARNMSKTADGTLQQVSKSPFRRPGADIRDAG